MKVDPSAQTPAVHSTDALATIGKLTTSDARMPPAPLPKDLQQVDYGTMPPAQAVATEKMPQVLEQLDTLGRVNFSIEEAMILLYRLATKQREAEWQISTQEATNLLSLGKQVYSKMMSAASLGFASSVVGASMTIGSATISAGFGAYGYKATSKANTDATNLHGQGLNSVGAQSILQIGHGFSQMTDAAGSFAAAGVNFTSKQKDAEVAMLQSREKFVQVEADMSQKFADEMKENLTATRSTLESIEQSRNRAMSAIYEV